MTLLLELDMLLDMLLELDMSHHVRTYQNEVSMSTHSKVTAQTDRHIDTTKTIPTHIQER